MWFTCDYRGAGENSRRRREALAACDQPFGGEFGWVVPPVLNRYTRIAVEMCAAQGLLRVAGYESVPGFDLPRRVTQVREVQAAREGAGQGDTPSTDILIRHHGHAALQEHVPYP
jgi:hypothetical protein